MTVGHNLNLDSWAALFSVGYLQFEFSKTTHWEKTKLIHKFWLRTLLRLEVQVDQYLTHKFSSGYVAWQCHADTNADWQKSQSTGYVTE